MKSLKKGFTLVELMVVIVIIGILAALAIPRFMGATNKSKASEFKPVLKQIYTLQQAFKQEKDKYSDTLALIAFDSPDPGISRFTYTSGVSNGAPTNGMLASATVKTGGVIKGVDGSDLAGVKACTDTSSIQYAGTKLAQISAVTVSANCP